MNPFAASMNRETQRSGDWRRLVPDMSRMAHGCANGCSFV